MSVNTYDELANDRMRRMSAMNSGNDNKKANDSLTLQGSGLSSLFSGSSISGGTFQHNSINTSQSSTLINFERAIIINFVIIGRLTDIYCSL